MNLGEANAMVSVDVCRASIYARVYDGRQGVV